MTSTFAIRPRPARAAAVGILTLWCVAAMAQPVAPEPEIPSDWPQWLQQAMVKESRAKRSKKLRLGDSQIVAPLVGKLKDDPEALDGGGWFVRSDIGGDSFFQCWIFGDRRDLANSLELMHDALITQVAEDHGGLSVRNRVPYFVDSGVYRDIPYLASEWIYTLGEEPDVMIGLSKMRVAVKDGATFVCAHNELGYRKTFARIFEQLVTEAAVKTVEPAPYYREIVHVSLADKPVGVSTIEFRLDEEGDTRIDVVTSTLVPIDAARIAASDATKVEFSRPDGSLINALDVSVVDGDVASNLALERDQSSGDWKVYGVFQGKDVEFRPPADVLPASALGQMLLFGALLGSEKGNRIEFPVWLADADPSRFLDAAIDLDERRDDDHKVVLSIGPLRVAARLDNRGSMLEGNLDAGRHKMTMRRVWVEGATRTPAPAGGE